MLLLYTTLFGYKLTSSKPEIMLEESNLNGFYADLEQTNSARFESTKKIEQIRKIEQAYHLERRFFQ